MVRSLETTFYDEELKALEQLINSHDVIVETMPDLPFGTNLFCLEKRRQFYS